MCGNPFPHAQVMCSTPRAEAAGTTAGCAPNPALSQSNDSRAPNPTSVGRTCLTPPVTAQPEVKVDENLLGSVVVFLLE